MTYPWPRLFHTLKICFSLVFDLRTFSEFMLFLSQIKRALWEVYVWALIMDSRENSNSLLLLEIIYLFLLLPSTFVGSVRRGEGGHSHLVSMGSLSSFTDVVLAHWLQSQTPDVVAMWSEAKLNWTKSFKGEGKEKKTNSNGHFWREPSTIFSLMKCFPY